MSTLLLGSLLALISAVFHALLALLQKQAEDRLVFKAVLHFWIAVFLFPFLFLLPLPSFWGFVFLGLSIATHWVVQMLTIASYERGDMGLVYPIMRGFAPLLVAIGAIFIVGEPISFLGAVGLAIIVMALIGFSWPDEIARKTGLNIAAIMFAGLTAIGIAIYTNIDARGARESGYALSFIVWLLVLEAPGVIFTGWVRRRDEFVAQIRGQMKWALLGAFLAIISYGGFIYATSIAPVAQMSALRETSVVWGALLAALVLGEPFGRRRIMLALVLVGGLILLRLG